MPELRVVSWNCFGTGQGLGDVVFDRAPEPHRLRHRSVIGTCASTDVLCLQEVFSRDAQVFLDGLGSEGLASVFRDPHKRSVRRMTVKGTGLGIGSRWSHQVTNVHYFTRGVGWDQFARKGALHAQIACAGGMCLDVITTHLQSGTSTRAVQARKRQLEELRGFVGRVTAPERPAVICGDFNVDGLGPARLTDEYRGLVEALPGFEDLGAQADLPTYEPGPEANALAATVSPGAGAQRIDYVFFRPAERCAFGLRVSSLDRILDRPISEAPRGFASDHFGLSAAFSFDGP